MIHTNQNIVQSTSGFLGSYFSQMLEARHLVVRGWVETGDTTRVSNVNFGVGYLYFMPRSDK